MTDAELHAHLKAHVMRWKDTGEILEAERRERVRRADTAVSLRRLNSLFDSAIHLHPPSTTSGLVQFYEILSTTGGVGIDVALGAFAFEGEAIRRGTEITLLPGRALRLCTAAGGS